MNYFPYVIFFLFLKAILYYHICSNIVNSLACGGLFVSLSQYIFKPLVCKLMENCILLRKNLSVKIVITNNVAEYKHSTKFALSCSLKSVNSVI